MFVVESTNEGLKTWSKQAFFIRESPFSDRRKWSNNDNRVYYPVLVKDASRVNGQEEQGKNACL